MSKQMLKTVLGLRAQIDRLTKLIHENTERSRRIALAIEGLQGRLPERHAGRKDFRLGKRKAKSK